MENISNIKTESYTSNDTNDERSKLFNLISDIEPKLKKEQTLLDDLELKSTQELIDYYCDMNTELFDIWWDLCVRRRMNHSCLLELANIAYQYKNCLSICNIGAYYSLLKKDDDTAIKYWKEGLELGDISCTRNYYLILHRWYVDPIHNTKVNENMAHNMLHYYLQQYELNNDPNDANIVGVCYYKKNNMELAEKFWKISYESGNMSAKKNYGILKYESGFKHYENGNIECMFEDFDISARTGDTDSIIFLAKYCNQNKCGENDMKDPKILYYLGIFQLLSKNLEKACEFFLNGHNLGDSRCKEEYANTKFSIGLGFQQNKENEQQMIEAYNLAIEFGSIDAMNNLGIYYKDKDINQCKKLLKMATDLGHKEAYDNYHSVCGSLMWQKVGTDEYGYF